ncbi:putative protein FAM10A4 [Anabrus simplex]|uniref:putative protein FAM10A4 n=1 Tax=Anabrus simplex TaxID=316456 RepID=UPI0034DD2DC0
MTEISSALIEQLKSVIEICKANPDILHHKDLAFFKQYIMSLGGKIPSMRTDTSGDVPRTETNAKPPSESAADIGESEESDIELDNTGVVEPDRDDAQPMGDPDKEVSEDDVEKSNAKKRDAIAAFGAGEFQKAIDIYTEAILLNPGSALLHAKRGQCYLKLNKPNACIRDCSRALQINPDNALAYKFRGRAHRLLGHWEEAAQDLRNACKIDFDEQADEWLKEVTPNARKLEEHRRKYERKRAEKDMKEKLERARRAREEHAKAAAAAAAASAGSGGADESGAPGMGDFYKFLNDPEILTAFQDPEVAAAFQDISTNPANIIKYQNNPKIAAIITKLATKFGGGSGLGGLGGGFPGFPGSFPGNFSSGESPRAPSDDVGLD